MSRLSTSKQSLVHRAYARLRDQIVNGELQPGDRVSQRQVAKSLGMSLAPVGAALRELSRDGLMEMDPGWGARVRQMDVDTLRNQHVLRCAIECEAARHCSRQATDAELAELMALAVELDKRIDSQAEPDQVGDRDTRFHLRIAELSRAASLVEVLQANQLVRMLARGSVLAHHREKPALQHVHLAEAIQSREPDLAERAMREHCFRSMQLQMSHIAMGGFEL